MENRARIALVTLDAGVETVRPILVLEIAAGILSVDALLALVRMAIIRIQEPALERLIWRSLQTAHTDISTVLLRMLAVVLPDLGAFGAKTDRLLEAVAHFLSETVGCEPKLP